MSKKIEIIEVGSRDGFQSVSCGQIDTELKKRLIDQLADAAAVTEYVLDKYPAVDLFALVPNMRGTENAYHLGLRKVVYVVSFSKSHNQANINRTHEQSLDTYKEIRQTGQLMSRGEKFS